MDLEIHDLDKRTTILEVEFGHFKKFCDDAKIDLGDIKTMVQELKDCVGPRLTEHGGRIGHCEADLLEIKEKINEKNNNGNGSGFPSKKTLIIIFTVAAIMSGLTGASSGKIFELIEKFLGMN